MYCGKCGREIKDTAKFCPYCGQRTVTNPNRYANTERKGKHFIILVMAVIAIVAAAVIYSLISEYMKNLPENRIVNTWYLCEYTDIGWVVDDETFLNYNEEGRWYSSEDEKGEWYVMDDVIEMERDDGIDGMAYFGAPEFYTEGDIQDLIQYTDHGDILTLRNSSGDERVFATCDWISEDEGEGI